LSCTYPAHHELESEFISINIIIIIVTTMIMIITIIIMMMLLWHVGRLPDLCQAQQRPELPRSHPLQPPVLRQGGGLRVVAEQQGRDGPAL